MPDARSAPRPLKDAGSRTRLPREVLALGVIAFFVMVGFGVVVPVLPIYVRSFGVGNVEVGAVISAFALMRLVASPFCGRLIDWGGERTILALGIGIVAVSSGLAGVAQSYLQLLLLRGAGGIGSAMFTVSAMTLLLGSTSPAIPARAIGFYQGGFLIGGMAGPALGGLLATISLTAPFFFYAATLAIAGVVGLALLRPGARVAPADASTPRLPLATVPRRLCRQFLAGMDILRSSQRPHPGAHRGGAEGPQLVHRNRVRLCRRRSDSGAGTRGAVHRHHRAQAGDHRLLRSRRRHHHGRAVRAQLLGVDRTALSLRVAAAFMGTAPAAVVGDVAGSGGGRPVAVFSMFSDFGAIIGPLVAGFLADTVSFPVAFAVGAVLFLLTSLYALRMPAVSSRSLTKH
jgi:DHA1 family multidrug resistance protein-like MFS transporter